LRFGPLGVMVIVAVPSGPAGTVCVVPLLNWTV
jgi:hypothetical protein